MSAAIIKRMREQRMQWVELDDGKKVRIIRPSAVDVGEHLLHTGSVRVEHAHIVMFATDWQGFTEADLLGAAIGSSDPLAFDKDLWAEYSCDRTDVCAKVSAALLTALVEHHKTADADEKNSPPG